MTYNSIFYWKCFSFSSFEVIQRTYYSELFNVFLFLYNGSFYHILKMNLVGSAGVLPVYWKGLGVWISLFFYIRENCHLVDFLHLSVYQCCCQID